MNVKAWAAAAALLTAAVPALAKDHQGKRTIKDDTTLRAASLSATCASCHNTNGKGVEGADVPGLSHLKASYIETQMLAFKSGERGATVMHQLAKGYTNEQIKIISEYLGAK